MSDLTKIHAGLYRHEPTGRLIVRTECWEGPRGGNLKRWEHADYVGRDVCIDGLTQLFETRAAAVDALICSACSHFHAGPCLCPECGKPATKPGGTCGSGACG